MARRSRLLLSSLAFAALVPAHAAELGDPRVASHIGQPLVADVELTLLDDAATPVRVRVASPEVYNGAGIAMPPVLSSLNLSVMRRDGRQFLHVTSLRPVDADHVHLYLELVDKGQRAVRLATLWLTPEPDPAPAPVPVRATGPVVVPAPAPASAPARVAGSAVASASAPVPDAVLLAQVERARAAHVAPAPPRSAPIPVRRPHPAPVARAPALPVARPAACAVPAGAAQACAALGAKNDELRARLGQVEDRMKKLQVSLAAPAPAQQQAGPERRATPVKVDMPKEGGNKAAPAKDDAVAAAPEPPKPVVHAGPRPIHSIRPLLPHMPKAPPPDAGVPWGWIGTAIGVLVLALGGAGAFVMMRRRKTGGAGPGLIDRLKARFAARARAPQAEAPTRRANEPAEPTLE
jgi:hypothetical protein